MADIVIRVEDLGKQYRIGQNVSGYRTLRDALTEFVGSSTRRLKNLAAGARSRSEQETIWALRHINFEVEQGTVLGVIGRNGAGKSTLLKLLARVAEPTEGRAEIRGRVGSLLEVGTGFHPELTGRENTYLNGAILGMKRAEIDKKFDEIIAFSEVEKFIDTPVKRYSSGMYLRLAFSVAAHLEPEILVVDEVLAVGDAEFQQKCLGKMNQVATEGRTVLFVSHNMSAVLRLTEEAILLDHGQIVKRGSSQDVVDYYLTSGMAQEGERLWENDPRLERTRPFRPISLRVRDSRGKQSGQMMSIEPMDIEFEYELEDDITGLRVGFYISSSRGEPIFTSFDTDRTEDFEKYTDRPAGRYISRCRIPANTFNSGRLIVGVNASSYRIRSFFTDEHAMTLTIDDTGAPGSHWPERRSGPLRPSLDWTIEALDR
ncbi:MAG: ABC transporter ATP-binding protein [Anaerolineales bacterium]|nr:ABC transporter ATP-binding protein [Anaerolineales bacterium]